MVLSDLLEGCAVLRIPQEVQRAEIAGIQSDSRRVKPGELFLCQKGSVRDGHRFAGEALARGAACICAEHPIDGVPEEKLVLTADTHAAAAWAWYRFTGCPTDGLTKIAVTGTAGKTTVAYLLRHVLEAAGHRVGMISTVETLSAGKKLTLGTAGGSSVSDLAGAMTTPDPEYFFGAAAQMKQDGCDTLIYEASSQALAAHRLDPVQNDAAVFTNLSAEHMDAHGTMEGYFKAKSSLMERTRIAVVNADDRWMARLPAEYPDVPAVRCSIRPGGDVWARSVKLCGSAGIAYVYTSSHAVFRITSPMPGEFSVMNTLEAAACALSLGADPMTVREAMSDFYGAPGRMQHLLFSKDSIGSLPEVYIDYAHTPSSLSEALRALRQGAPERRLTVLFGCGGERDRRKRPEMARAAQNGADFTVITGDNPRGEDPGQILDEILAGVDQTKPYVVIPNRRDAIRYVIRISGADDTVLLAGKGHETYEITKDGKKPFDEEALVRQAILEKQNEIKEPE